MKNIKRISKFIIELLLFCIIIFSLYMIIKWFINTNSNRKIIEEVNSRIDIEDIHDGKSNIDFNYLLKIDSDTVGYLSIDNTDINYPVVRTTDNNYYLNHSFDKTKNVAGWIFMDSNNKDIKTDKNTVIYGHNMKDGSMFGKLKLLKKNNSNTIYYYDSSNKYEYRVFSIYEINEEDYYINTVFNSDKDYLKFIQTIAKRSMYDYEFDIDVNDNIITLSTCTSGSKRLVVHAYRVN